ncbi:hypothetical protein EG329_001386 [Mollisiaceae sp. DMI_Dod_QoI]|nr:hypothetical protein EG329_001386 [Helotiales sp. DMI_Dod_QoI]
MKTKSTKQKPNPTSKSTSKASVPSGITKTKATSHSRANATSTPPPAPIILTDDEFSTKVAGFRAQFSTYTSEEIKGALTSALKAGRQEITIRDLLPYSYDTLLRAQIERETFWVLLRRSVWKAQHPSS